MDEINEAVYSVYRIFPFRNEKNKVSPKTMPEKLCLQKGTGSGISVIQLSQMFESQMGSFAASGSALNLSLLNQERFIHLFDGAGIFTHSGGDGV